MLPEASTGPIDVRILAEEADVGAALARSLDAAGLAAQHQPIERVCDVPTLVILAKAGATPMDVRMLRQWGISCPLLVVGDGVDGAQLLHAGADALLASDAPPCELVASVRALARRSRDRLAVERQVPDASLLAGARQLRLTPTEQRILEVLARRPGRVVTRDLIVDTLYAGADAPRSSTVDVFVHGLRRKLDGAMPGLRIETVRGAGFRLAVA